MPKRICWTRGMRLTDEVMKASDQCSLDIVNNAFVLASAGRFGLLPSSRPFELSLDVVNGMVDVSSLNCTAITRSGHLIEARYDTRFNNSFDTRVPLPAEYGMSQFVLTINVQEDQWTDTNDGYEEQAYSFQLVPIDTPIGDNSMPIAIIREGELDVSFVPPCVLLSAHPKYKELLTEFLDILKSIDQKAVALLKTSAKSVLGIFWPIIQQLLIEVDKEGSVMTPMALMARVQRCVSAFNCACALDDNLSIENADMLRQYVNRSFNYKDAYQTIKEGIDICFRICENVDNLQTHQDTVYQPPRTDYPAAPTIDPSQLVKKCANKNVRIQLINNTPGARVYYTVDGSEPTESSKAGLNVTIENSFKKARVKEPDQVVTIKAKAVINGTSSPTSTFNVTLVKDISIWTGIEI